MSLLEEEVEILTVGHENIRWCGLGFVQLGVSNRHPIDVEVLIVDRKPLGYKLLLGVDIIKRLGGVCMTSSGTVNFLQLDWPFTINKPDFHAEDLLYIVEVI